MKKGLLLNPPGNKYFIRDYYCSHIPKGKYYWPPLDLLVLSGLLKNDFELCLLDAIAEKKSCEDVYNFIRINRPDFIICVTGSVSWCDDIQFLSGMKQIANPLLIISGDYPLAEPRSVIEEYPFIDAVLLDFIDNEIIDFISNRKESALKNVFTRLDNGVPIISATESEFSVPVPRYEIFPLRRYHLPHIYYHPFATILTDFGCLSCCTFCPFERISHKIRRMDNVGEELEYLASLGIKELWLRDQSFGSSRKHALDFCKLLGNFKKRFSWSCEMRIDSADEELLRRMKASGCHTVMFGVETANEDVLKTHKKGITVSQIRNGFELTRKIGVRSLAHFIFGLPGENVESQLNIIKFCLSLNPDYASFNVAAPVWNTSFRDKAKENDWLKDNGSIEIDSSCSYPVWESDKLKRQDIWQARTLAVRKFYFRKTYILNQIKNLKTYYQLCAFLREGLYLLVDCVKEMYGKCQHAMREAL